MLWLTVACLVAAAMADPVADQELMAGLVQELSTLNRLLQAQMEAMSCPPPFVMIGNECFFAQTEDMTWHDARVHCLSIGADLAAPTNLPQVREYITTRYPRKDTRNFWIGGTEVEGKFQWLNGRAINETHWYTNEPSGNGDCLAMFDGWEHPLTDFPCENQRRSLCQRAVQH